eukprot:8459448-Pyramimonas_sp.AAC.1
MTAWIDWRRPGASLDMRRQLRPRRAAASPASSEGRSSLKRWSSSTARSRASSTAWLRTACKRPA